jgi:hypothetical protein
MCGGTWPVDIRAGAASRTSERYTALLLGPETNSEGSDAGGGAVDEGRTEQR